ncbi:MAG: exodeoxyribonuclease III [Kiritimatiellia bacterium]
MLIATFNANSIRSRLAVVLDWLKRYEPDMLCIQETKVQDHEFPLMPFEQAGWHVAFRGEKSYNGVAIISRHKPDHVSFGMHDGAPPDETRFCHAQFNDLHLINTYVPQGREIDHPMYAYKNEWFVRLRKWFTNNLTPTMPVVWVGDLNVAPEPDDIHNAERQANHVCYHEQVRNTFRQTVDWGFVDVYRQFHQGKGHYTFFDYRTPNAAQRAMGWRIDHILATPPMAQTAIEASIDLAPRLGSKPSDHTFLYARFK